MFAMFIITGIILFIVELSINRKFKAFKINVLKIELDNCEQCNGSKGGQKGNENIVNGKIICDYCNADAIDK